MALKSSQMKYTQIDILILGGGLSGSLLAWRLKRSHPHLSFLLIEKGDCLGGNHTWSFHKKDVSAAAWTWLEPLISKTWDQHRVVFPRFQKTIPTQYASIRSELLHRHLMSEFGLQVRLKTTVERVESSGVFLDSGEKTEARWIFDARGTGKIQEKVCGFQKFFGLDLKLKNPHGLKEPLLMDASVEQKEGYRFLYCLPWNETEILVEDTRYSLQPSIDSTSYRREIENYCAKRNWVIEEIIREEKGSLPLPLDFNFTDESKKQSSNLLALGMRARLMHPTTGYSLPDTVRSIEYLTALPESQWMRKWPAFLKKTQRRQKFFMRLNRVMFFGRPFHERYLFLQHFYQLPFYLMGRFYSGQMKWMDKLLFFLRRAPVPLSSAFQSVLKKRSDGTAY